MRLLIIIFLLVTNILIAQDNPNVFTLKLSLGLNGCQVHGDTYDGYKKLGLFGGLAVNAHLNEKTSLELGFYFSQKGARKNPTKDDLTYYRLNLNYVDLPLSLRCMLNKRYFITFGPSVAYLINYNENIDYTVWTVSQFEKYEVSVNVGLGRTMVKKLSIEVRSTNSIRSVRYYGVNSTVFYPNPVANFFNKGFYNNILTVMLTYKLDRTKKSEEQ